MITLDVDLGDRSYPIFIGSKLLGQPGLLEPYTRGRSVLIVTNDTIAPLYLKPLAETLGDCRTEIVTLPDGEAHKTADTLMTIYDALVEHRFNRDCVIVTLGGGVVGDIGGYAAASWQRGVDFIQVPTTLLAQVDSAVGGKTAINHPGGKNLIGAFHQPRCVLSDTDTLQTLPDRELSAGLAEVVKYGLIEDSQLFDWLEEHAEPLYRRDQSHLQHAVRRSCEIKADIVGRDEREQGVRALLNFGHTFGHAIERCAGYGEWLHGEAVAAGMRMAASFSQDLGRITPDEVERIAKVLRHMHLPTDPPKLDAREFLNAMSMDKKVAAGQIRLVLLKALGSAELTTDYPEDALVDLLAREFIG